MSGLPSRSALAAAIATLCLVGITGCTSKHADAAPSSMTPTTSAATAVPGVHVKGEMLMDGSVNGCGGEQALVQVRESGAVVGSAVAASQTAGADCVYPFDVPAPVMDCYELAIDHQPVGRYPSVMVHGGVLQVGIVLSDSVYGDPESSAPPPLYADFVGCGS